MTFEVATTLVGGLGTLAIFSFLWRENPFFRFFEHLYIGISAGFGIAFTIKDFFYPRIFSPMLGLDIVQYPDGTVSDVRNPLYLLFIAPMLFGLLYYFIFSARYSWLAKLVIGFTLGISGGIAFKAFFNDMTPQIIGSFKPLLVFHEGAIVWMKSFSNTFFVVTLLSVMSYFFFTFKRTASALAKSSFVGRWLMMVCFGAFFGSTVMARMALLVERLQFLIHDWSQALWGLL